MKEVITTSQQYDTEKALSDLNQLVLYLNSSTDYPKDAILFVVNTYLAHLNTSSSLTRLLGRQDLHKILGDIWSEFQKDEPSQEVLKSLLTSLQNKVSD